MVPHLKKGERKNSNKPIIYKKKWLHDVRGHMGNLQRQMFDMLFIQEVTDYL
jgi:hypothetical protein